MMNIGVLTIVVAAVFSTLGLIAGFFIGKMTCGNVVKKYEEPGKSASSASRLENESSIDSLNGSVVQLKATLEKFTESILKSNRTVVEAYEQKLEKLLSDLKLLLGKFKDADFVKSGGEIETLYENLKKSIESKGMTEDISGIFEKIKDKLDIVRTELESVKLKLEESKNEKSKDVSNLNIDFDKLERAVGFAKEINEEAIKGTLINLIYTFKDFSDNDRKKLVKTTDAIALNSKQIVLLLEDFKKTLKEGN